MLLCATVLALAAQTNTTPKSAREEIRENPYLAGSNHLDYDRQLPDFRYTKPPKGYTPFYFSHYGPHGSRWLISENSYERVLQPLRKARAQGKLTREGETALRQLEQFNKTTYKRLGDLTTVGERQHHGIGRRMAEHFPEIFKAKGLPIDARSTVVERCILSMVAECEELMAANPTARIHNDVSKSLQYYLNQSREGLVLEHYGKGREERAAFTRKHTHPERLTAALFSDAQWATDSLIPQRLMLDLFEIAVNMQSHDNAPDLLPLFTNDELYDLWRATNANWYVRYGASPLSGSVMPFGQKNLLKNFIETADTCVALGKPQATLRFGHEVRVLPLACLMELDSCGVVIERLEDVENRWKNYRIFPMACNIQLIFYKPKKGPRAPGGILVKALLNEREISLPVPTATYPYYKWDEVRAYWLAKLKGFEEREASRL